MKKALLALATVCVLCPGLSGCVDDNPNVLLLGVTIPRTEDLADELECNVDDTVVMASYVPICSGGVKDISATLLFKNFITGEVPWNGGGSGSGTTYKSEQGNPGMIWIDRIYLKCVAVVDKCAEGDDSCYKEYETSCSGEEALEIPISLAISGSEGGACYPFTYSVQPILNWISDYASDSSNAYVNIDVYAHYHDSGKMSGNTSHTIMQVRPIQISDFAIPDLYCNQCADVKSCCGGDGDYSFCPSTGG